MRNFGCFSENLEIVRKANAERAAHTYEIVGVVCAEKIVADFEKESKNMVMFDCGHLFFGFEDEYCETLKVARRGEKLFIKTVFNKNPIVIMVDLRSEENAEAEKSEIIEFVRMELGMYNFISPIEDVDGGVIYD